MKEFILKKNRKVIDLKIFLVDFESIKNMDNFVSTMSKILIANKYNEKFSKDAEAFESSMINFTSTYDKSRRSHEKLMELFQIVEQSNSKTMTSGIFGYQERLKLFLQDKDTNINKIIFN